MELKTIKKALLAGTALIAFGGFTAGTEAADLTHTTGAVTWASAGGKGSSSNVANASAGDNINFTTAAAVLTVTNGGADDGSVDTNTFAVGNLSNTGVVAGLTVTSAKDVDAMTSTFGNVNLAGAFTIDTETGDAEANNATFTGDVEFTGAATTNAITAGNRDEEDILVTFEGDTVTFANGLAVASGTNGAVAQIVFAGTNQTVSGAIDLSTGAGEAVVNNGTTVTFDSEVEAARFTNNGTVIANNDAQITFGLTQGDQITGNWVLVFDADGGSKLVNVSAVTGIDANTIQLDVAALDDTTRGNGLTTAFENLNFEGTGPVEIINDGSLLVRTLGTNASDDINLTFEDLTVADLGITSQATSALSALVAFDTAVTSPAANSAEEALKELAETILEMGTASQAQSVAETLTSDVSAGAVVAGITASNQSAGATNARLASLRTGTDTGVAAGELSQGLNIWTQAFGTQADQDERDGVSGYEADTYGFALGLDTEVSENTTIGLSFSYANTDVDSDGLANTQTDVDSYQISVYGEYDINESAFVSGQIGYVFADNEYHRDIAGNTADRVEAEYDADQLVVRAEIANKYDAGNGLTITPSVLANYVRYDADSYSETGDSATASAAALNVDSETLDVFELGLGVELATRHEYADSSVLTPSLKLGVRHDLIGEEFEATNSFAAANTNSFKVEGFDPAQTTFNIGAGAKYESGNVALSAAYDYEFKEDFDSHSALIKLGYKF